MNNTAAEDARGVAQLVHQAVKDALEAGDFAGTGMEAGLLSVSDIATLIDTCGQPRKVLQVGGGAGASTAVLALAFPNARIIRVDPDLPAPGRRDVSAGALAKQLIGALGAEQRVSFVSGGFSETVTRRSVIDGETSGERPPIRVVGPEICSREQPFDLAFIEGLSSADARASDIRLAASALAPAGTIVSADSVGARGATVRAGVFEFLRYYPDYAYVHDRLNDAQRSLGYLRRRSRDWPGTDDANDARSTYEAPMEVRNRLAGLVALAAGKQPILELAVGAPVLGAALRRRGLSSRTLRLTGTDWNTHFFDPVIDQIGNALEHTPGSVLFSSDILDHAPDEFLGRLFARLADRHGKALFFATPPGEALAGGPRSRPGARVVDLAASQNMRAFAPAALEFERARHEGVGGPGWLGDSSRYANFLMFARSDAGRDARGRSIPETSPQAVQVREQVELQRIWAEAKLQRSLQSVSLRRQAAESERDDALSRWREANQAVDEERAKAERSLESLRGDIQRMQAELSALTQDKAQAQTAARDAEARRRQEETAHTEARTSWEAETGRLRGEAETLRATIDQLTAELAHAQAQADEGRSAHEARIAELEEQVERIRSERAALVLEKDEAEAGRRRAETEAEKQSADLLAKLSEAQSARDLATKELEGREAEFERRFADLQSQAAEPEEVARLRAELEKGASQRDARDKEIEELRAALSAESLQVVDAQCREVDAQASLEGIANHIALTHDALHRFRANPEGFLSNEVPYPLRTEAFEGKSEDLVARAGELHGRAADLSREVAEELERLGVERIERETWTQRRGELAETAHEEALRAAKDEFASQHWAQDRLHSRVAAGLAFNNRLLGDILALTPGLVEDPLELATEVAELELSASSAVSFSVLDQVAAQEKRLLHLLHTLEAEQAFGDDELEAALEPEHPAEFADSTDTSTPDGDTESEGVVTSADFGWARDAQRAQWDDDAGEIAERQSTIVEFSRPERGRRDDEWPNGDAPAWYVGRNKPSVRKARAFWTTVLDRIRTYPETARLVRLHKSLHDELVACPVSPRVFDVSLYKWQGSTDGYAEPLHHYLLEGEEAGWSPLSGFDPAYYATQVGDLGEWKGSLLRHFLTRGVHDRRSPSRALEGLADRATAAGMEPLEFFYHWENAARGTWQDATDDDLDADHGEDADEDLGLD